MSKFLTAGLVSTLLFLGQGSALQAEPNDKEHTQQAGKGGAGHSAGQKTGGQSKAGSPPVRASQSQSSTRGATAQSSQGTRRARTGPERTRSPATQITQSHQHGTRYVWGDGAEYWFYDGYYHGDCNWLRRKARATGSQYWLQRYRLCRALD